MGKAWWLAVAFSFTIAFDSRGAAAQYADSTTIPNIAAPPRTIAGLGKLPTSLAEIATPPSCVVPSEKLTAQRVDAIAETMETGSGFFLDSLLRFKAREELRAGQLSNALALQRKAIAVTSHERPVARGQNYIYLATLLAQAGEFRKAEKTHTKGLRFIAAVRTRKQSCLVQNSFYRHRGEAAIAFASGDMKAAAIRYGKAYQKLEELRAIGGDCSPRARTLSAEMRLGQAEALLWDGRLMAADSVAREAIRLSRKSRPRALILLSDIFLEQGRMTQAFRVALGAIRLQDKLCVPSDALNRALAYEAVIRSLIGQRRWREANEAYQILESLMRSDPDVWASRFRYSRERGLVLLKSGEQRQALTVFLALAAANEDRLNEDHYDVLEARALAAVAQAELGQHQEARRELSKVFPKMIDRWREGGGDSTTFVGRLQRMRLIGESYLRLLLDEGRGGDRGRIEYIRDSFRVADAVATRGVHRALAESVARSISGNEASATLVRQKQDAERGLISLHARLNTALILGETSDETLNDLRSRIASVEAALSELSRRVTNDLPDYATLVNPPAITIEEVAKLLGKQEAIIVTFSGEDHLFAWGVSADAAPRAHMAPVGRVELSDAVLELRVGLDPVGISTIKGVPDYDVALAHELYATILEPLEAAWKDKPRLFVVADGPLGAIPFAVLTSDGTAPPKDTALPFDRYRGVSFLARSHAIARLPAVSALAALRRAGRTAPARRPFIGFGDPIFDRGGAKSDQAETGERGGGAGNELRLVRRNDVGTRASTSATLKDLVPLPDTAEELLALADVLGADKDRDIHLGLDASESTVDALNRAGKLKDYRTISFATHGLVPGDLDGLNRPALALSEPAPEAAERGMDGLLTTNEIMSLDLNADWVVLSACNTAAGTGAEAVSGLGRAFFFAGARSVLVSSWPVHSAATVELMTRTFGEYARAGNVGRAESLRAAMVQMIEQGVFKDARGRNAFSYAHPMFWAPFMVVGDGA